MEDEVEYRTEIDVRKLTRTTESIVICWKCKGEGVIERREFFGHTEGYRPIIETCHLCQGKGRLRETNVQTYVRI